MCIAGLISGLDGRLAGFSTADPGTSYFRNPFIRSLPPYEAGIGTILPLHFVFANHQ